jgi:hypothetical protein
VRVNECLNPLTDFLAFPVVDLAVFGLGKCAMLVFAEKGVVYTLLVESSDGVLEARPVARLAAHLADQVERFRPTLFDSYRRITNQEDYY